MTKKQAKKYIDKLAGFYFDSGSYNNEWLFWLMANEVFITDKEFDFWSII